MKKEITTTKQISDEPAPVVAGPHGVVQSLFQSPHVVTMRRDAFDVYFVALLALVHNITGRTLTEDQIRLYCSEAWKDINRSYAWLHIHELRHLMSEGAKGKYGGTVYDISYTTIVGWIESYRDSTERRDAVMDINKRQPINERLLNDGSKPEELERAREEHLREMAVCAWNIYTGNLNGGHATTLDSNLFMLLPDSAFTYLEKTGKIKMTREEKKQVLADLEKRVASLQKAELKTGLSLNDSLFYIADQNRKDSFMQSVARKYCTAVYFQKLISNNETFKPD